MSTPSSISAMPGPRAQERVEPDDLLPLIPTRRGQVSVIVAPPGSGKSTAMYGVVAQKVADSYQPIPGLHGGKPFRVLWAVHGLYGDESLGEEAASALGEQLFMRGGVKLLKGRRKVSSLAEYYAQFTWSDDVAVCIISHAHLPHILSPSRPKHVANFMADVDFIVVDEDPLLSLAYSSTEADKKGRRNLDYGYIQRLKTVGSLGIIEGVLHDLMSDGLAGKVPTSDLLQVRRHIDDREFLSLTGRAFWQRVLALGLTLTSADLSTFEATISTTLLRDEERGVAADIVRTFQEDWEAALAGQKDSYRFGLSWEKDKPETMRFRCDVLRPVTHDSPPIVVLDAYAVKASQQYQLMFPRHGVEFHTVTTPVPLEVEYDPDLYVDRTNLLQGRQPQRRNHVLDRVGQLAGSNDKGALVLSYKRVNKYLSQRSNQIHLLLHAPTLRHGAVAWAHWYAGRGVNHFAGRHVVALHPPERPRFFEHHLLAALAPQNGNHRKNLARHLRDTELLQMLHRGRQTTYEPGDPKRPRIILAFRNPVTDPRWVVSLDASGHKSFRDYTPNPHHREAVTVLANELVDVLGAVPHICLVVLGLYRPSQGENALLHTVKRAMKTKTRRVKRRAPHLDAWKGDDHSALPLLGLSPYKALDGTHVRRILADLHASPLLTDLQTWSVRVGPDWGGRQIRVYAVTQLKAEEAIRKLGGLP